MKLNEIRDNDGATKTRSALVVASVQVEVKHLAVVTRVKKHVQV